MKKLFTACLIISCLMFCPQAFSEEYERIKIFPAIGICTGNGVRVREDPNTNSKILAKLFEFNRVIVLGVTASDGMTWYEIDHPEEAGTGWVAAQYFIPQFRGDEQKTALCKIVTEMFKYTGCKPLRAFANLGEPKARPKQTIEGDVRNYYKNLFFWDGCEVEFLNNNPVMIYITKAQNNKSFGGIKIGDSIDKAAKLLGSPDEKNDVNYKYNINEISYLSFGFSSDKKIKDITYQLNADI